MDLVGRSNEIQSLLRTLGATSTSPETNEKLKFKLNNNEGEYEVCAGYPLTVVYGYNSTDCATVYSKRQAFTDILRQVDPMYKTRPDQQIDIPGMETKTSSQSSDGYHNLNFLSFVRCFKKIVYMSNLIESPTAYFVFDNVQTLLDRGFQDLLRSFCCLNNELSVDYNFCIVLITRGISVQLEQLISPFCPTFVYFPQYSEGEILDILVEKFKMWSIESIFRPWIQYLYNLFRHDCHDWIEFRYIIIQLMPTFRKFTKDLPVDAKPDAYKSCYNALLEETNYHVKQLFRDLFHHKRSLRQTQTSKPTDTHYSATVEYTNSSISLPFGCLLLVLASFLASFNPQENDTLYFSNNKQKRNNSKKTSNPHQKEKVSQRLIGPKTFGLQRLLAIYSSIHAEYELPVYLTLSQADMDQILAREDVFVHISMLVRMRILERTSSIDDLDDVKLRCLADYEFVENISKQIEFPLEKYLNQL